MADHSSLLDDSVSIIPQGYCHSLVIFKMSDDLIISIQEQIQQVTGDNITVEFADFIHNALLEYLRSEEWRRARHNMIQMNKGEL